MNGNVGTAPSPNTKTVTSRIGSLQNAKHKPGGGNVQIPERKLNFKTTSKPRIGSLENSNHIPSGGDKKIPTKKVDYSRVSSRCGSLQNATHTPTKSNVKIFDEKPKFKAKSKIGSLANIDHQPGGGDIVIYDECVSGSGVEVEKVDDSGVNTPTSSIR